MVKKVTKPTVKKKVTAKPKKFVCYNCGNAVSEKDTQMILTTCKNGKVIEEVYFHADCWVEYFNKCVTKKAKENVAKVQKRVMGLMDNPIVKSMLANVKGTDNLMSMLQMPLTEETIEQVSQEQIKKVKEKIDNDRKRASKPRKRTKKAQMH